MLAIFLVVLNDALKIFFDVKPCFRKIIGFKRYLNETFLLKQYSYKIKSLRFICSHTALLILLIF
jgi:hypothetical protein